MLFRNIIFDIHNIIMIFFYVNKTRRKSLLIYISKNGYNFFILVGNLSTTNSQKCYSSPFSVSLHMLLRFDGYEQHIKFFLHTTPENK